jgi:hypothetical protein
MVTSVCLAAVIHPPISAQFPRDLKAPPHVTVLYFEHEGDPGVVVDAVEKVVGTRQAFTMGLTGGVAYFHPSDSSNGLKVAFSPVQAPAILPIREAVVTALMSLGIKYRQNHPGHVPHATLGYIATDSSWAGQLPVGQVMVTSLELWVGDEEPRIIRLRNDWPFSL